jgi:hypothetical protein
MINAWDEVLSTSSEVIFYGYMLCLCINSWINIKVHEEFECLQIRLTFNSKIYCSYLRVHFIFNIWKWYSILCVKVKFQYEVLLLML